MCAKNLQTTISAFPEHSAFNAEVGGFIDLSEKSINDEDTNNFKFLTSAHSFAVTHKTQCENLRKTTDMFDLEQYELLIQEFIDQYNCLMNFKNALGELFD